MELGRIQGLPNFFDYALLSQEWVKLRTSYFVGTFIGLIEQKPIKNFVKSIRGRTQRLSKTFRAPIYRAHRAVIFAIRQFSFLVRECDYIQTLPYTVHLSHGNWSHVNAAACRNSPNLTKWVADLLPLLPPHQSSGLRQRSYDKTGFRPTSVLVLVLQLRSWSYTFGLHSNSVMPYALQRGGRIT